MDKSNLNIQSKNTENMPRTPPPRKNNYVPHPWKSFLDPLMLVIKLTPGDLYFLGGGG